MVIPSFQVTKSIIPPNPGERLQLQRYDMPVSRFEICNSPTCVMIDGQPFRQIPAHDDAYYSDPSVPSPASGYCLRSPGTAISFVLAFTWPFPGASRL